MHLIEPLDGAEDGRHALYLAEHLLPTTGTCGVSNSSLDSLQGPRVSAAFRPRVSSSLGASLWTALPEGKGVGGRLPAKCWPRTHWLLLAVAQNWPLARETRYVELYVVTDTAEV